MDKYINKPLPMVLLPLRSSSCKDMDKLLPTPSFPQRSTSLPRLSSTSAQVSEELDTLPKTTYAPSLINKQLPPLPPTAEVPEKLGTLQATKYVQPSTSKALPTLPAARYTEKYSRKPSNARISNDSTIERLVAPRSVTLDTPPRTHSLLSPPAQGSPPLRKKPCSSRLLPPDEVEVEVEVESLMLVTVQPPTPGTTSASIATSSTVATPKEVKDPRLDVKKRKKRKLAATKTKNRQSMIFSSKVTASSSSSASAHKTSFYRGSKKVKHDSMALYRRRRCSSLPRVDSRKSIFHMIQRPAEAISPPPSVPKRTFEQMYLQILEERWAYYRQLDVMCEADEKREVKEYLAAHPVGSAPSAPLAPLASAPPSAPPSDRRSSRQAHSFQARYARKLPAIPENGAVTKTTAITQTRDNRVMVGSPYLFPIPRSPRKRLQHEEQRLKRSWRDWLHSSKKPDEERRS